MWLFLLTVSSLESNVNILFTELKIYISNELELNWALRNQESLKIKYHEWYIWNIPLFYQVDHFNKTFLFSGNANLVYTIIRKRTVFHQLANLPIDHSAIAKALTKRGKKVTGTPADQPEAQSMEGSIPATDAEPGTLKASLAALPGE